jgi:hypothetical protein
MPKRQRKAEEGHLEEGEAAKPTSGMKSGKTQRKSKEKAQNKTPLTISMQAPPPP